MGEREYEWKAEHALVVLERIEHQLGGLEEAARGSDSALVSLKLDTLRQTLGLLRGYLEEAERVEALEDE